MNKIGKSIEVRQFILDLESIDTQKFETVSNLYSLFSQVSKSFTDKFIYGGIGIYLGNELIGGIWVSKNHVSESVDDEGGWYPAWEWSDFLDVWKEVRVEIAGVLTVKNLILLKRFDKIYQ